MLADVIRRVKTGGYHPFVEAILADGPVGLWVPDDYTGSAIPDAAGSNDATAVGSPTFVADAVDGMAALEYDGSSDYLSVGDVHNFTTPFSLEVLVTNANNLSSFNSVIGRGDTQYMLRYAADAGEYQFFVYNGNWTGADASHPIDVWAHVVAEWDGSELRTFVDGSQAASDAVGSVSSSSNPLWIGRNSEVTSRIMEGMIGPAAIYDRALSSSEISDHYAELDI